MDVEIKQQTMFNQQFDIHLAGGVAGGGHSPEGTPKCHFSPQFCQLDRYLMQFL